MRFSVCESLHPCPLSPSLSPSSYPFLSFHMARGVKGRSLDPGKINFSTAESLINKKLFQGIRESTFRIQLNPVRCIFENRRKGDTFGNKTKNRFVCAQPRKKKKKRNCPSEESDVKVIDKLLINNNKFIKYFNFYWIM